MNLVYPGSEKYISDKFICKFDKFITRLQNQRPFTGAFWFIKPSVKIK
jgi:hypothetical protein